MVRRHCEVVVDHDDVGDDVDGDDDEHKRHSVMMMVTVMIMTMPTIRISLSWLSAQAWFVR